MVPSIALVRTELPEGATERETRPRGWGGGEYLRVPEGSLRQKGGFEAKIEEKEIRSRSNRRLYAIFLLLLRPESRSLD